MSSEFSSERYEHLILQALYERFTNHILLLSFFVCVRRQRANGPTSVLNIASSSPVQPWALAGAVSAQLLQLFGNAVNRKTLTAET